MPDSSVFRDLRCLGEGAQGKAVLVEHVETGERMCVKRISVASSKAAEQAEQEVAILSRLSHPSITKIFGAWHEEHAHARSLAILMEFADGGCLSDVIRARNSPFDEAIVMEYVVQTAAALAYMHRQSVIHRDLKAANIFLTARNLVKVGDFGIAKVLESASPDEPAALARTAVGTPYYLAPELISGEPYAFKADMWALGVLLYELVALRRPFEAATLPQLALKIVKVDHPPPPAGFSEELLGLLGALLQRDPAARPTAQHVCAHPFVRRHHVRLQAQLRTLAALVLPIAPPADEAADAPANSPAVSPADALPTDAPADVTDAAPADSTLAATAAVTDASPAPRAPSTAMGSASGAAVTVATGSLPSIRVAAALAPRAKSCVAADTTAAADHTASGGRHEARAAACALRMQRGLVADGGTVSSSPPPPAVAEETVDAAATSAEAREATLGSTPTGSPRRPAVTPTSVEAHSVEANLRFSKNLHALEHNLAVLEQAGERLPERTPRRAHGTTTPFSSPFSAGSDLSAAPRASPSPLGASNSQRKASWVEPRRKPARSSMVPPSPH